MARAVDGTTQRALDTLQARITADPDIQRILAQNKDQLAATRDRGGNARDYQKRIRDQITAIAEQKGYIPEKGQYFLNPNDGQLEPHGGWSGLSKKTKAIIIAAAAVGTAGAGMAIAGGTAPAALGTGTGATAAGGGAGAGAGITGGGLTAGTAGAFAPAGLVGTGAGATTAGVGAGVGGTAATGAGVGSALLPSASNALWQSSLTTAPIAGVSQNAAGLGGGGGALGFLRNNWRDIAGAAGSGMSSAAQTQASNRANEMYAQYLQGQQETERDRDFWNQGVEREKEGRESGTDAWRRMLQAQRVLSPGASPQLSPYSVAPRQRTDVERTGAQAMSDEVMRRLQEGNPLPQPTRRAPSMDMSLARGSAWENLLGYTGAGLGAFRPRTA